MSTPASRRDSFVLSDGLSLSYLEWGDDAHAQLLLLHGGGLNATDWREVAPELAAAGFHVTAPDLRGCGESDWDPEVRYGVEQIVADVEELVRHLGLRDVRAGRPFARRDRGVRVRRAPAGAGSRAA